MVYPADEETFDGRNTPEFIREGHLNSIQTFLKRIQDFLGYGGRLHDEAGLVMPVGSVIAYAGTGKPDGWLWCDGQQYNGASGAYVDLYAAIVKRYGGGADSLFNVPDTRGYFLRGFSKIPSISWDPGDVIIGNETIELTGQQFYKTGLPVRVTTDNTLPAPLVINTTYYLNWVSGDLFRFSTTRANAMNDVVINLTNTGVGTSYCFNYVEEDADGRLVSTKGGNVGDNIGTYQDDAFQGHRHYRNHDNASDLSIRLTGGAWDVTPGGQGVVWELETGGPRAGAYGAPRLSVESRVRNINVNYIIKL